MNNEPIELNIEVEGGQDGYTPQKGVDYFTEKEQKQFVSEIMSMIEIPVPKDGVDGKDAEPVDYKQIKKFVKEEIAKIPKPKDGKDAEVDYKTIITSVMKQVVVPAPEPVEIDYDQIKKYIKKELKDMPKGGIVRQFFGGSAGAKPTLQQVTDEGSTTTNSITAQSFITTGGTSADYVKGDGSLGTPDLSGYVPYTGATTNVDLGVYNLTAYNLTADFLLTAGQQDTFSVETPDNGISTEIPSGNLGSGTYNYHVWAYKVINNQQVFSPTPELITYEYPIPPNGPPSVGGYQTYGGGYYASGNYSEIYVYPYKNIGGTYYVIGGPGSYAFYDDGSLATYNINWSWTQDLQADGYYITKASTEWGWNHEYYIDITDNTISTLSDTGTGIWNGGAYPPVYYGTVNIELDWDTISADGYRIFFDTSASSGYVAYYDTTLSTFTDDGSVQLIGGTEPVLYSGYDAVHNLYGGTRVHEIDFYGTPSMKSDGTIFLSFKNLNANIGFNAGPSMDDNNQYNLIYGEESGYNLVTNNVNNTFFGYRAGYAGSTGLFNNTAIGREAGRYLGFSGNTTSSNTFIGPFAGYYVQGGSNNTYIGPNSGPQVTYSSGNSNIGIGNGALRGVTSGTGNQGYGESTLYTNTTGGYNFAAGYQAMRYLPSGSYNFAAGSNAGNGFDKTTSFSLSLGYWANNLNSSNDPYGGTWYPINGEYQGAIGAQAVSQRSSALSLGGSRNSNFFMNVGVGHLAPAYPFSIAGTMFVADNIYTGLGAEKITNGTFTGSATGWTLGTGWAYSSNTAAKNANGTGTLSQTSAGMVTPLVVGEIYQLEFTVSALTAGELTVTCGGRTLNGNTNLNANSRYTYVFEAITTGDLVFTPSLTTARFTIDTVSLKRVTAGDLIIAGNSRIGGTLGLGVYSPSAKIHAISTTEQMRLGYDTSNYYSTTVSSTGLVTLNAVGSGSEFLFSDRVRQPGTFAEIYVADASATQSIPTGATYTKLTPFTTNGSSSNATADQANDKITITKAGKYLVTGMIDAAVDTANTELSLAVHAGGTIQNNIKSYVEFQNINVDQEVTVTGIISVAANTDIDLRVRHDDAGSVNVTVENANLTVTYLGE